MDSVMDAERLESKLAHCDGQDCRCGASACVECACYVDWTPAEVYTLRAELATERDLHARISHNFDHYSEEWRALKASVEDAPVGKVEVYDTPEQWRYVIVPDHFDSGQRVRLVLEDSDGS